MFQGSIGSGLRRGKRDWVRRSSSAAALGYVAGAGEGRCEGGGVGLCGGGGMDGGVGMGWGDVELGLLLLYWKPSEEGL